MFGVTLVQKVSEVQHIQDVRFHSKKHFELIERIKPFEQIF